jgi:hypothetical protein
VEGRRTSSFSSHCCHDSSIPGYCCGQCSSWMSHLSDLRKSLLEGTLETIMWSNEGLPVFLWVEVIFT